MTYIQPLILFFSAIAFIGLWRTPRSPGRLVALIGLLAVLLVCWPPADWLLSRPLEAWYPIRPFAPPSGLQAIVVLSSDVDSSKPERPYPLADADTFGRCEYAAWLYHHYRPLPVLACGGPGQAGPYSAAMRELLVEEGVPENMIWTEERSHSTHQNALYGAAILRQQGIQRIALVVEARSMPRAAACFRKEGLTVIPAPSDFRTWGPLRDELVPNWKALRRNEITLHEAAGLAWYKLRGWI